MLVYLWTRLCRSRLNCLHGQTLLVCFAVSLRAPKDSLLMIVERQEISLTRTPSLTTY